MHDDIGLWPLTPRGQMLVEKAKVKNKTRYPHQIWIVFIIYASEMAPEVKIESLLLPTVSHGWTLVTSGVKGHDVKLFKTYQNW